MSATKWAAEYAIVEGGTITELAFEVNRQMDNVDGWEPHGSMVAIQDADGVEICYYQPMVRYEIR